MRKITAILIACYCFFQMDVQATTVHDMDQMMQMMNELELEVTDWEVTHIVKMSKEEAEHYMLQTDDNYVIIEESEDGTKVFQAEPESKLASIDQQIQIVEYAGNSTLQLTISSNQWNEQIESYYKLLTSNLQSDVKLNNVSSYTCVLVEDSDIIINGLLNDELWDKMKVVHTSEQKETLDQSVYEREITAYTPLFQQEIDVNNDIINMQMMIKNTQKNKKQLIIGTPVILNEY